MGVCRIGDHSGHLRILIIPDYSHRRETTHGFRQNIRLLRSVHLVFPFFHQSRHDDRSGSHHRDSVAISQLWRFFFVELYDTPFYIVKIRFRPQRTITGIGLLYTLQHMPYGGINYFGWIRTEFFVKSRSQNRINGKRMVPQHIGQCIDTRSFHF